jgi:heat-inducible transcriptional repressor
MPFKNLTERESEILKVLIDHYIATAEPVASGALAKFYNLNLSSATIRNTIKSLEEMDLVQKPHTSAGRVPTDHGYRLYVDSLVRPEELTNLEKETISAVITKEFSGIEQVLEQTSRVLGNVSKQLGITISPQFESGVITKLELIPVAERRGLVVLALKSGLARTILLEVETDLRDYALSETSRILNERLCGLTIRQIRRTLKERLAETSSGDPRLIEMFIDSSAELLKFSSGMDIHFGDAGCVLNQPEFKNPESIKELINLIDERKAVGDLITKAEDTAGISVSIGFANTEESDNVGSTAQLSLLSSSYTAGKSKGALGIIGPMRMPYSKLIGIVDYTAKRLTHILSD